MVTKNPYDPEVMRARFWELKPKLEEFEAQLEPLQAEQAEIANYRRDREMELNGLIKGIQAERAVVAGELATLVKALGGKTGEAADEPYDAKAVAQFHRDNAEAQALAQIESEPPNDDMSLEAAGSGQ